jgi:glycosyltransferase involved in cell wall biosynthesis
VQFNKKELSFINPRKPSLTIGMPVFNDIHFIEESLKSILDQTFVDFLLILSDDGSTDGSEAVCRHYAAQDSRIEYIRQPKNLGISKNMEFLLKNSRTEYFLWAADDDLWHPEFCKILILELEKNNDAISAFCKYDLIDESGTKLCDSFNFDYSGNSAIQRLKKYLSNSDDGFGYGIFRTNEIKEVKFPVWWWPNKKSAYNNIFPTLCFYLAKGQYAHYSKESLFFKRVKTETKTHHIISGKGNAIKETITYIMRRFNLVVFSAKLIVKGGGIIIAIRIFPKLFYQWFLKSSRKQIALASKSFWKNKVLRKGHR